MKEQPHLGSTIPFFPMKMKIYNKEGKSRWTWLKINNGVLFLKRNQQMMGQKKGDKTLYKNAKVGIPHMILCFLF